MNSFTELEVWKTARVLRIEISKVVKSLPNTEKFRLSDQLIRSSRSITANIAEGFGRYHFQENIQFCRQSRGSLQEVFDHLICARDEKYISKEQFIELTEYHNQTLKLLNGYIKYLKKAKSMND